jgi:hypothetical protein
MLTDPQSITIADRNGGSAISLPCISRGATQSKYRSADGSVELIVSQTEGARNRRSFRVNLYDVTADPFIPTNDVKVSCSFYGVWDGPQAGYTVANLVNLFAGVTGLLSASTNAVATKVVQGET